jgi:hypothetical protein
MRPECHGKKMQPGARYIGESEKVFITYRCSFCGHRKEVEMGK